MADVITIKRPDVVALIENAAKRLDQEAGRARSAEPTRDRSGFATGSTLSPPASMPRPVEKSTGDDMLLGTPGINVRQMASIKSEA
jgi:hypothetical protein